MDFYKKILFLVTSAVIAGIVADAKVMAVAGKGATDNGGVYIACVEDEFPWSGAYNTNISGLSIVSTEVLNDKQIKPDPEFTAYEISLRLLDMAHNCREALLYLSDMLQNAPIGSSYATFAMADKDEAWIVEYAGKNGGGAVWAGIKIPEDGISIFNGKAVIHKLPKLDLRNCIYSPDIFDYAKNDEFDFAKTFAPADYAIQGDLSETYASLRTRVEDEYSLWGKPYQPVSLYDLRKMLRTYSTGSEYYSYITETNSNRPDYLQSITYFAPGKVTISSFIPIFRYAKKVPAELNPLSEQYIACLMAKTAEIVSKNPDSLKNLRGMQIAIEDSVAVDVNVAIEQLPEFEDEEIAIELLQDLADIWAAKVKENYAAFYSKYAVRKEE